VIAMVVDDSSAMRRIQQRSLEAAGWQVLSAANGKEALERLLASQCQLVLTDWHMPEMDGLELVREIRKDERLRGLRVVMVTSDATLGSIELALAAGANDFVMKPFTAESLAERVAEVMA
jgi:two-component system chemotaxis response regulator CheY